MTPTNARDGRGPLRRLLTALLAACALVAFAVPGTASERPGRALDPAVDGERPDPAQARLAGIGRERLEAFARRRPGSVRAQDAGVPTWPREAVAGRLLVTLDPGSEAHFPHGFSHAVRTIVPDAVVERLAGRVRRVRTAPGREAVVAATLAARPGVLAVEPVRTRTLLRVPNDPGYPKQWAHDLTGAEEAWDISTGSSLVRVAVIDSGVFASHPDLAPNVVEQVDTSTGRITAVPLGSDNDACEIGHGTAVAGVAGAVGDNGRDVAGVSWQVGIVDIAISSPSNGCTVPDDAVVAAMDYAVTRPQGPVDVINLSLGGIQDACPTAFQAAVDQARAAGAVVVAASGNEEDDAATAGFSQVPASCNGVISTGAIAADGTRASYSTSNRWVDLAAPGGDGTVASPEQQVLSTSRNQRTEAQSGTSFSAPYVSGLAALLRAVNPSLTPDDVEAILERTSLDAGPSGRDPQYGWGVVQAGAAARMAAAGGGYPAPQPDPDFPVADDGGHFGMPPNEPTVFRLSPATGPTEPITQAVANSQFTFAEGGATHGVLARRDDYADALAGSALGFGYGPLLFTSSSGPLAAATRDELERVLPPGSTVYLLGGTAALPPSLEAELRDLGFEPVRLAGATREETAVVVAREVRQVVPRLVDSDNLPIAILATRGNWPDAVAAGSLAAFFGIPILLTPPDTLHPVTADALAEFQLDLLYVVGGRAAISDSTVAAAADAAGTAPEGQSTFRLASVERTGTMVAVSEEFRSILRELFGVEPSYAIATNVRRSDGFTHVLSASAIAGAFTGVFVPVEDDAGTVLTEPTETFVRGLGIDGVLVGGADAVSEEVGARLEELLRAGLEGSP